MGFINIKKCDLSIAVRELKGVYKYIYFHIFEYIQLLPNKFLFLVELSNIVSKYTKPMLEYLMGGGPSYSYPDKF